MFGWLKKLFKSPDTTAQWFASQMPGRNSALTGDIMFGEEAWEAHREHLRLRARLKEKPIIVAASDEEGDDEQDFLDP